MSQVSIFRSQKPICWERYFDTRQMLLMIQKNSFVFLLYDIVCFQVIFILLVFNVFIASLSTNMSWKRCSRRVENNCLFQHSFIIFFEISFGHNQMHSKQEKVERIDKTLDFFIKNSSSSSFCISSLFDIMTKQKLINFEVWITINV